MQTVHNEQNINILNKDRIIPYTYTSLPHLPHPNLSPGKNAPKLSEIKSRLLFTTTSIISRWYTCRR